MNHKTDSAGKKKTVILAVDDELNWLKVLNKTLESAGYQVVCVSSGELALKKLEKNFYDLVIADLAMPKITGIQLLKEAKTLAPDAGFIIITGRGSIKSAVTAIKEGADDYITKPWERDELLHHVELALNSSRLKRELKNLRGQIQQKFGLNNMVGRSPRMMRLFETARKVADSEATVLIQGESGTGKELLARATHLLSPRSNGPLVTLDCASMPLELLQSELFGHLKGAFTGAHRSRRGLFEEARAGTIFLDEINDIPPPLQLSLLRVLQEREIRPIGSDKTVPVDVRVISASNRNLKQVVEQGEFRRDLYYRLAVITLEIPPLRERTEDIPTLAQHFLEKYSEVNHKKVIRISSNALNYLLAYRWEGNVRELENVIERAVVLTEGDTINADLLPREITEGRAEIDSEEEPLNLKQVSAKASAAMEIEAINSALKKSRGNKKLAAQLLGISRGSLYNKLKEYDLN